MRGRRKKPSGHLHRGPFTARDFEEAVRLDGWEPEKHGRHPCWRHPTRRGKIQIDRKWTGVKPGHDPFRGVMRQGGYTKDELLRLLNGIPLD
jgi:hypothetical protein